MYMNNEDIKIEEAQIVKVGPKVNQATGLPLAIFLGLALIAGAVYFQGGSVEFLGTTQQSDGGNAAVPAAPVVPGEPTDVTVRPVSPDDHVLGDRSAPVTLIEYSDTECPFCKRVHPTLQQLVQEYDGKVKWVYRHFPLDSLHSKARKEAEATECANELGGNDAFWAYLDRLFEVTPSNNGLESAQLPQIAEDVGLNRAKFEACLASGKYAQHVSDDLADAQAAGGNGTPYNVVIGKDGKTYPVSGAQPLEQFKTVIEQALR